VRTAISILVLLGLLALDFAALTANRGEVFIDGRIYFADADCYSRMTRVERFMEEPFRRIAHHDFENYPEGTDPHTTSPLDALIAGLAWVLAPFSAQARDVAGAWISPLLGLATVAFLGVWSLRQRLRFGSAMLLLVAVSPMLVQAFKLGRPDHQSLTLLLIAAGLAMEFSLWDRATPRRAVLWGVAWGAAFWVTLYEPVVLFAFLLIVRLAVLRGRAITREWGIGWLCFLGVFGFGILADGWRIGPQAPLVVEYFPRWSRLIGELQHLPPFSPELVGWIGWLLPVLPILLVIHAARTRQPVAIGWLLLLGLTYGLTLWQLRWGSFFALVAAMAMPWGLAAIPSRAAAWVAFALSLFPVARQWDGMLYPGSEAAAAKRERIADAVLLRQAAGALVSAETTPVLAPWWLSPPLTYWSGQPCVAGSSHQSLPGIVESARFYLGEDDAGARAILDRRRVKYVVAYEPDRVLGTSATLLRSPIPPGALGQRLYASPRLAPPFLLLVYSNPYFKIYEVQRE